MEYNYNYEELLMIKTVWYYYFDNLTQQQISEQLGITRMRVVKLLEKARLSGVIQFKMRSDSSQRMEIERELLKKYALNDCFVVPTNPNSRFTNESIAKAASMYISDRITDNCFINIGYGDTLSHIINNLAISSDQNFSCVSLTGGVSYYLSNISSSMFNVNLQLTPAPLLASTKEMADAIKKETSVQEISKMASFSSMSIVGIGSMSDEATIIKAGMLSKKDFLLLSMQGAVGDILCHFIDKNGNLIDTNIEDRLVSTPLEALRKLNKVIGVAAGKQKVEAIRAALRGKYLDTLITDEETAVALISEE